MNMVSCSENHIYDSERFDACPFCNKTGTVASKKNSPVKKEKQGLFGIFKKSKKEEITEDRIQHLKEEQSIMSFEPSQSKKIDVEDVTEEMKESDFYKYADVEKLDESMSAENKEEKLAMNFHRNIEVTAKEVINTSPSNNDDLTISLVSDDAKVDPVVAWLVAVEGEDKGKSYPLVTGRNSIGRSFDCSVDLTDKSVSRKAVTYVIYEPNKNQFFIQVTENKTLVYINGNLALENKELHNRDLITVGNTSLIFVPFCNEEFTW